MSANETGGGFIKPSFKRHMIRKPATLVVNSLSRQAVQWRPGCPRVPRLPRESGMPKGAKSAQSAELAPNTFAII